VRDKKVLREERTLADLSVEYIEQHAMMKKRDWSGKPESAHSVWRTAYSWPPVGDVA
jgi:hypothetical protein